MYEKNVLTLISRIFCKENFVPYITQEIEDAIEERDAARITALQTGNDDDWQNFRDQRRDVLKMIRKEKYQHDLAYLDVDDTKQQWSRIKLMSGLASRERSEMKLKIDGTLQEDEAKIQWS